MREINTIIIHCAATKATSKATADDIRQWHEADAKIGRMGYHYVIERDATLKETLELKRPGVHCTKHNANSIGVCLMGGLDEKLQPEDNFTDEQMATLLQLLYSLVDKFPEAKIYGHNYFNKAKACPCFDWESWLKATGLK